MNLDKIVQGFDLFRNFAQSPKLMRVVLVFLIVMLMGGNWIFAQSPELIPYQAIARNGNGAPLAASDINLVFKIRQGALNGMVVYEETQALTTDSRGYFTTNIGSGNVVTGSFSNIDWANNHHFMQILINGVELGNQQLLSVPYALHSKTAEEVVLSVSTSGDTLFSGGNSFVIVPGISAANFTPGCTDPSSCNYSSVANLDNGSCLHIYDICNDNNPLTINDAINVSCECQGFFTGSTLLAGNSNCTNAPISVSGCGGSSELEYQGITYSLVEIGGQCWFADNLATSQYRDGSNIPNLSTNATWVATTNGAYCTYANLASNNDLYGKLYNWFAVNDSRGVCPVGWHVPSDCDWMFLENSIGLPVASQTLTGGRGTTQGGKLKSTALWLAPNTSAVDEFNFSALPGGYRNQSGSFRVVTTGAYFWTSSAASISTAHFRSLLNTSGSIFRSSAENVMGMSIRCVKD